MASEAASPADGDGAKKEVSNEKLKKYIHQLRAKVKKLEEELVTKTEELEASGTSSQGAPAEGADTGEREEMIACVHDLRALVYSQLSCVAPKLRIV